MTVLREIKNIKIEGEFHTCPECGYVLGFHTSFLKISASKDSPVKSTRDVYQVILICPECGMQVRCRMAGYVYGIREPRSKDLCTSDIPFADLLTFFYEDPPISDGFFKKEQLSGGLIW